MLLIVQTLNAARKLFSSGGDKLPEENVITNIFYTFQSNIALKNANKLQEIRIKSLESELNEIKKNIRFTKLFEYEVEIKTYYQEVLYSNEEERNILDDPTQQIA